ncbi:MAG: hypothetical protein ACOCQD_02835 [archaeon]
MNNLKKNIVNDWFFIDELVLGCPLDKAFHNEQSRREKYLSAKGAFLENLAEIYKNTKTLPKVQLGENNIHQKCQKEAQKVIKETIEIINNSPNLREEIQNEIKKLSEEYKVSEDSVNDYVSNKNILSAALDRYLLESTLNKLANEEKKSFKLKTCLEAHNYLKENLLEIAL